MTLNWSTVSRDDKNAAIAEHVLGRIVERDMWSMRLPDEGTFESWAIIPDYLSDACALMKLADRFSYSMSNSDGPFVVALKPKGQHLRENHHWISVGKTFEDAVAIALLRAHGVEVST